MSCACYGRLALQLAGRKARRVVQLLGGGVGRRIAAASRCGGLESSGRHPPGGPYDVLCLPIIEWDYRFQRPQQLMRQFARHGHRVFYMSHQFLLWTQVVARPLEANLTELRLRGNVGQDAYHAAVSRGDAGSMADALARLPLGRGRDETVVIVQLPFWTRLAEDLRDRFGWRIVYDCMDDLSGFSRRGNAMIAEEPRLLEIADVTIASSEPLRQKILTHSPRVALVRNGVDYEHFAAVQQQLPLSPRGQSHFRRTKIGTVPFDAVIGYYGAIARWFDSSLVAELAALRPRWRLRLVGDTYSADLSRLRKLPNLELLGERRYAELPGLIADWDCCIIPFKRTPLTEATNPVKVYEMLASGKPVVAVDLPELRPLAAAGLIQTAGDAAGFAAKIAGSLADDSDAKRDQRRAFARQNTWIDRFHAMAAAIADCRG